MNNSTDPQQKQLNQVHAAKNSTELMKQIIKPNAQDFKCKISENMQATTATLPPPKVTSDIRPEKVKMAQKLIQNPHYPTPRHLDEIADALLDEVE